MFRSSFLTFLTFIFSFFTLIAEEPKPGEVKDFDITTAVKMKFCWIPAGEAQLGSPKAEQDYLMKTFFEGKRLDWLDEEAESARGKFKTKGFWLGKYEVTQAEGVVVMKDNPSYFKGEQLPMENISWEDCQRFISKCKVAGLTLRLPHEDEWEYACRGGNGNARPFYWGGELNGDKANCYGKVPYGTTAGAFLERTTEVGSYERVAKHPWGLCDMAGNVREWCDNVYSKDNPERVFRGGSFGLEARGCRSAVRASVDQKEKSKHLGFRLALIQ